MRTERGSALGPALFCAALVVSVTGCERAGAAKVDADIDDSVAEAAAVAAAPMVTASSPEEAGRYLVLVSGCNDCHTDNYLPTNGDVPEEEWLKGSVVGFTGPWGTTYPANLRLTVRDLTEDQWVEMLGSRKAMPPMPWPSVAALSDTDRRAMYRYIRTLGAAGERAGPNLAPGVTPAGPWIDFVPKNLPVAVSQ